MGIRMGLLWVILPMVALIQAIGLYDMGGGVLHQVSHYRMVISIGILIDNAFVIVGETTGTILDEGHAPA